MTQTTVVPFGISFVKMTISGFNSLPNCPVITSLKEAVTELTGMEAFDRITWTNDLPDTTFMFGVDSLSDDQDTYDIVLKLVRHLSDDPQLRGQNFLIVIRATNPGAGQDFIRCRYKARSGQILYKFVTGTCAFAGAEMTPRAVARLKQRAAAAEAKRTEGFRQVRVKPRPEDECGNVVDILHSSPTSPCLSQAEIDDISALLNK